MENIWLARVQFPVNASDNPISWTDDVPTFFCIDPAMNVHHIIAFTAMLFSGNIWAAKISN